LDSSVDRHSWRIHRLRGSEAIANARLRRMERELELRGIRFDRPNNDWVVRKSQPTERS
jgi:hypothetical protein